MSVSGAILRIAAALLLSLSSWIAFAQCAGGSMSPIVRCGWIYSEWANIHRTAPSGIEQSAVAAMSSGRADALLVVGGMFRAAYERGADGSAFGVVSEVWTEPGVQANLIAAEFAAKPRHDNDRQVRGIDVVFKTRPDGAAAAERGENHFNENSAAIYISAQPRSTSGEYSGWQTGVMFDAYSLDRSRSVPYMSAIDLSRIAAPETLYFVVWSCPPSRCGLRLGRDGGLYIDRIVSP